MGLNERLRNIERRVTEKLAAVSQEDINKCSRLYARYCAMVGGGSTVPYEYARGVPVDPASDAPLTEEEMVWLCKTIERIERMKQRK